MCASALSTGNPMLKAGDCKYKAVLRRSKIKGIAKPWALSQDTKVSDLQHCSMCTSRGKLTFRELKLNLKTTESRVIPSIHQTRDRIARDNKVPISFVSPFIAAKTRLVEAKQIAADYHANWSKLDGWGQEFKERNPGSVVHVDVDQQGRFKRMFVGLHSASWVAAKTGRLVGRRGSYW